MSTKVQPTPEGYGTVTPWIIVRGVDRFLGYLRDAFGAEEIARIYNEDGTIGHAEARIGDSMVMMFDAAKDWPDTPAFMRLYVEDGDAVYQRALAAGGAPVTEMTKLFFGDRVGRVRDPWGNIWWIQERMEDVSPEEMGRRLQDQAYTDAMRYLQGSLDRELSGRGEADR
ncbi:VOC family protein [Streptosporangium sp. NPDC000396]|uniref:VOC family protein n=1 Tax=Streptosporangium sp. NPDC000396 TaxID=3366185 RepID=UPI0036BAA66E